LDKNFALDDFSKLVLIVLGEKHSQSKATQEENSIGVHVGKDLIGWSM